MTAKAAFDLWQAGRLEEAAACYREALDAMPADDDVRGEIHGDVAHGVADEA